MLLSRVAHKLVYYAVAIIPFALVFFLCRDYFPGWPAPSTLAAGCLALVMAFVRLVLLRPLKKAMPGV